MISVGGTAGVEHQIYENVKSDKNPTGVPQSHTSPPNPVYSDITDVSAIDPIYTDIDSRPQAALSDPRHHVNVTGQGVAPDPLWPFGI